MTWLQLPARGMRQVVPKEPEPGSLFCIEKRHAETPRNYSAKLAAMGHEWRKGVVPVRQVRALDPDSLFGVEQGRYKARCVELSDMILAIRGKELLAQVVKRSESPYFSFFENSHSWRRHVDVLESHVKEIAERGKPGWDEMGKLTSSLEDVLTLAKAKLALLVRGISKPGSGTLPAWAQRQLQALESKENMLSAVIKRAEKLISAASLVIKESTDAEIEQSGPGRIAIEWRIPDRYLRWIVRPCELPWPGIDVEVLEPDPQKPTALVSQRFYDAPSLLAHLRSVAAG